MYGSPNVFKSKLEGILARHIFEQKLLKVLEEQGERWEPERKRKGVTLKETLKTVEGNLHG